MEKGLVEVGTWLFFSLSLSFFCSGFWPSPLTLLACSDDRGHLSANGTDVMR